MPYSNYVNKLKNLKKCLRLLQSPTQNCLVSSTRPYFWSKPSKAWGICSKFSTPYFSNCDRLKRNKLNETSKGNIRVDYIQDVPLRRNIWWKRCLFVVTLLEYDRRWIYSTTESRASVCLKIVQSGNIFVLVSQNDLFRKHAVRIRRQHGTFSLIIL